MTCEAAAGAPIVAIALTSGTWDAAASTAAPPSEWPISSCGACGARAATPRRRARSSTFELKLVLENSPSLAPRPVKSKRRTPKPATVSWVAMHVAAWRSLLHVKQWANTANPGGGVAGRSSRAANTASWLPANSMRSIRADTTRSIADPSRPDVRHGADDARRDATMMESCRSPTCSCTGRFAPGMSDGRSCGRSSSVTASPTRSTVSCTTPGWTTRPRCSAEPAGSSARRSSSWPTRSTTRSPCSTRRRTRWTGCTGGSRSEPAAGRDVWAYEYGTGLTLVPITSGDWFVR